MKIWRRTLFRVGKYIPLWKRDCNSLLISKFANKLRYVMRSYWFDHCHKQAGPASASSPTAWAPTPTWPTAASPKEICYLSPITRRRSDMSTWPKLTTTTSPVSLFPLWLPLLSFLRTMPQSATRGRRQKISGLSLSQKIVGLSQSVNISRQCKLTSPAPRHIYTP